MLFQNTHLPFEKQKCLLLNTYLFFVQLYSLVSAAILRFVGMKKTSFPDATRSKEQFRKVPKWKIAMIFVRMVRHVLACHASKHWNRYGYENWKFNVKAFNRWMQVHDEVITSSPNWKNIDDKLPEVFKVPMTETPKKKVKRRRLWYQQSRRKEEQNHFRLHLQRKWNRRRRRYVDCELQICIYEISYLFFYIAMMIQVTFHLWRCHLPLSDQHSLPSLCILWLMVLTNSTFVLAKMLICFFRKDACVFKHHWNVYFHLTKSKCVFQKTNMYFQKSGFAFTKDRCAFETKNTYAFSFLMKCVFCKTTNMYFKVAYPLFKFSNMFFMKTHICF